MVKRNGGLSKTARASLGTNEVIDRPTRHIDPATGEPIMLSKLYPVKVMRNGRTYMVYHNKDTYRAT